MKITSFVLISVLMIPFNGCYAEDFIQELKNIKMDYENFYLDPDNLIALGAGIGIAGIFANTSIDRDIQEYYRERIKGRSTDHLADGFKLSGEFLVTIPMLIGTRFLFKDTSVADWSQRSLRAIFVGTPSALFTQRVTGASRPEEGDSRWRPFKDSNGLSGHAFIGAVPFITAAKMNKNAYIKGVLYGASLLPALSRINDNKHYLSQVALGWYLAFLSSNAVEKTNSGSRTALILTPLPGEGLGILISRSLW